MPAIPDTQSIPVPEVEVWLDADPIAPYTSSKACDNAKNNPWLIFHTSGTTGLPKLITYMHRMMTTFRIARDLPEPIEATQLEMIMGRRRYSISPMSQFSGLCAALQVPRV